MSEAESEAAADAAAEPIEAVEPVVVAPPKTKKQRTEPTVTTPTTAAPPAAAAPSAPASAPVVPAEYMAQLDALRAKNAALEAEREGLAKTQAELKAASDAFNEKLKQSEAEKARIAEERRRDKITAAARIAAMEHDAIDPDDVIALVGNKLTLDEAGNVIAADDTKASASDFIKGFLDKKRHLQKPRIPSGSGATPFAGTAPAARPPSNHNVMTREGATAAMHEALMARIGSNPTGNNSGQGRR